jgi:hypothetical protein
VSVQHAEGDMPGESMLRPVPACGEREEQDGLEKYDIQESMV